MPKTKPKKKLNPFSKRNLNQFRTDNEESEIIRTKALMYSKGVASEFLREAALNYRPIKKVSK